jgi:hypothetical protein
VATGSERDWHFPLDRTTTLVPNELILDIWEGAVELRLLARFRYLSAGSVVNYLCVI